MYYKTGILTYRKHTLTQLYTLIVYILYRLRSSQDIGNEARYAVDIGNACMSGLHLDLDYARTLLE